MSRLGFGKLVCARSGFLACHKLECDRMKPWHQSHLTMGLATQRVCLIATAQADVPIFEPVERLKAMLTVGHVCNSITRDNLGPYKKKVLLIPVVYITTTLVRHYPLISVVALDVQALCVEIRCRPEHV